MEGKALNSTSFDVVPFWEELESMLKFVQDRLLFGQTDVEGKRMEDHIRSAYGTLRRQVIKDEKEGRQACRIIFWEDCKKALDPVFDAKAKQPRSSISFEKFYMALHSLQIHVLGKSQDFWKSGQRPNRPPFPEAVPKSKRTRDRSRSQKDVRRNKKGELRWECTSCQTLNLFGKPKCWRCNTIRGGEDRNGVDVRMGKNGIWQWRNPPSVLYEGKGFFIFFKPCFWLCDTPSDPRDFESFCPRPRHAEGHFTMWIREKYASTYPFMYRYDKSISLEYGLLNRLDRETSGPVIVCKDEDSWRNVKRVRDSHEWHKEYVCLVHGHIPAEDWEGVLENFMQTATQGQGFKTRVVEDFNCPGAKVATSVYEVLDYFEQQHESGVSRFTLVKVRIISGLTHQIRVHMQYLLRNLGPKKIGENEEAALVSDFLYMHDRRNADEDKVNLCERVFLHEQRMGMWDPEDSDRIVYVVSELPKELSECINKLSHDTRAKKALGKHKAALASQDRVQAFCQKYKIDAMVKRDFSEPYWANRPRLLNALFDAFEERAGEKGIIGLNVDGDHTLLMSGIVNSLKEWWRNRSDQGAAINQALIPGGALYEVMRHHIDDRLWHQQRKKHLDEKEAADAKEPLPPGWRRMERGGEIFYLHERGRRERRRPVPDDTLPDGWLKLATSQPNVFIYNHAASGRNQADRPSPGDHRVPLGWTKIESKNGGAGYYVHKATGTSQFGLPCEGPPEDLPPMWEKVASSKAGGKPYYFCRANGVSQHHKPEDLPPGWQSVISSKGSTYYFHRQSGKSQVEKPTAESSV
mmetsp:Transcript_6810/g.18776  ORF Transcript_6810/g.18776 Transcript_6810/m.18776 type:complete len:805 (+) Transcript_6810:77-2491(+)